MKKISYNEKISSLQDLLKKNLFVFIILLVCLIKIIVDVFQTEDWRINPILSVIPALLLIGFIVYFIYLLQEFYKINRVIDETYIMQCPNCKKYVSIFHKDCPVCKTNLDSDETQVFIKCKYCKELVNINKNVSRCPKCGERLE